MAKKVTRQDIFADDIFTKIIEDAKEFNTILNKVVKTEKASLTATKDFMKSFSGKSFTDVQKFNKAIKETEVSLEVLNKTKKQQTDIQQKINLLQTEEGKSLAALNLQLQNQRKVTKEQMKDRLGLTSLYEKESARLNTLRKKYKDIVLAQGASSKSARKLRVEVGKLDSKLKRVDAAAGQFQRSVGNYGKAFGKFGGLIRSTAAAFGAVGGIYLFANAIREAFKVVKEFEKSNATLSGVLQLEGVEMKALQDDAKRLGATTAKTATEVTQLQIAYARLGFTQTEILNLTEATINGSIALNSEISETATLTGAMVNTFDEFSSIDAPEVMDVMALATAKSALNFEKLQKGLPIVAGAANAVGVKFTTLTALMGKLADSGIDVSTSSTALRNIFIKSKEAGEDYDQIIERIKGSQDKLTASVDAFGVRAAVSSTILSANISATAELDKTLQNAAGTADGMARKELNTLDGSIKLLTSAWQGLILGLEDGTSIFSGSIRAIIDFTTALISGITPAEELSSKFFTLNENINNLSEDLNPLLDRYDKLKEKGNLATDEQIELDRIINAISTDLPIAVTEFDKYGKAIDISTTAAREFIKEQKEILKLQNAEAIEDETEKIDELNKKLNSQQVAIHNVNGELTKAVNRFSKVNGNYTEFVKLTNAEVLSRKTQKNALQLEIDTRTAIIAKLKGERSEKQKLAELATIDEIVSPDVIEKTVRLNVKRLKTEKEIRAEIKATLEAMKKVGMLVDTRSADEAKYQKQVNDRVKKNNISIAKTDSKEEKQRKKNEQNRKDVIQGVTEVTNHLGEELSKRNQLRINNADKEIAEREDSINMQQRLAENGLANSLAFEQEAKAKAEVERERLAEKQQRREKVLAYFNLLSGFAEKNPDTAAAKAFAQIAIAETISGFFKDGIEGIGTDNSTKWRNTGTDDYLVAVDKGEGITTAKGTAENKGLVTAINSGKVPEWFNQNMGSNINNNKSQILVNNNGQLIKEVKQVVQAIKNQPENSVNWDSLGNRIETQVRNGVKKSVRIVKGKSRI